MKVYVDKLPKDCWDCPMHDGENGWCKMLVCYTDYIPKECPLQSLAEYTKQVRKEICEEIREKLKLKETHMSEVEIEDEYDFYYKEDVEEILDQIQDNV